MLIKERFRHFIILMPAALLLSYLIQHTIWKSSLILTHTFLELLCVFMGLMMFVLVWYSFERIPVSFQFIGFSYLIIAVFLLLHSIYFLSSKTLGLVNSLEYIMIARIFEALSFFSLTIEYSYRMKKSLLLVSSLAVCIPLIFIVSQFHDYYPVLFTGNGYTKAKVGLDIFVFAVLIFYLYKIHLKLNDKDIVGYGYIYAAILIALFTSVNYLLHRHPDTLFNIFGHVLRVFFYYHLFKGVFVSAITYPYQKLEEILDQLPIAISTYNKDFRFSFANKMAKEICGYPLHMLQGVMDSEIINKIYVDKNCRHIVRELADKHRINPAVRTLLRQDGSTVKIVIEGFKLRSGGYLCVFDTARRMQAFENMQLQSQAILNSISNFVIMVDTQERVIMCNRAFSEAVQMKMKDIIGMDISVIIKKTRFSRSDLLTKEFIGTQANVPMEASIETEKGEKREWLLHLAYIKNIEKEIMGYIAVGTDVTEIKKQQEEAKQKEKLAILGQMASGIVHEIRNPVTAIMGFTQLLKMRISDEKMESYCQHIESELNRLNKIVSDFLLFARPRNPVFAELSLKEMLESMNLLIDSYVFFRGIKIIYEFEDDAPIYADKNQIEQVILNIVKNAVDAVADVKEPLIRISTGYDNLFEEGYIIIFNNGKALNPEQKQKIGTPFFTTKTNGTGLGLSICKQIINDHGGKMTVRSEEDWGTAFELAFPAKRNSIVAK